MAAPAVETSGGVLLDAEGRTPAPVLEGGVVVPGAGAGVSEPDGRTTDAEGSKGAPMEDS